MYKFNEEAYKRYFFYGDSNPEGTLDGILFFVYENEMYYKHKTMKKEELEETETEEFIKEAIEVYKQYYRFVELNNRPGIYNFYRTEKNEEQQLKTRIKNKIDRLKKNGDNGRYYSISHIREYLHYPEYSIKFKDERAGKYSKYTQYNGNEWWKDEEYSQYIDNEDIKGAARNNDDEYIPNILRHWTEDIYDILKFLKQLEEKDHKSYIDLWLRTRLNRAKKGTIPGIQDVEIRRLEHACERIRKIRLEEESKKQEAIEENKRKENDKQR